MRLVLFRENCKRRLRLSVSGAFLGKSSPPRTRGLVTSLKTLKGRSTRLFDTYRDQRRCGERELGEDAAQLLPENFWKDSLLGSFWKKYGQMPASNWAARCFRQRKGVCGSVIYTTWSTFDERLTCAQIARYSLFRALSLAIGCIGYGRTRPLWSFVYPHRPACIGVFDSVVVSLVGLACGGDLHVTLPVVLAADCSLPQRMHGI